MLMLNPFVPILVKNFGHVGIEIISQGLVEKGLKKILVYNADKLILKIGVSLAASVISGLYIKKPLKWFDSGVEYVTNKYNERFDKVYNVKTQ